VFPLTRRSIVLRLASPDGTERERAREALVAAYWKPVYKYLRVRWGAAPADAEDLTQGFFLRLLERDALAAYDPARSRFRTFVRVCLDRHVANEHKAEQRAKRGGQAHVVSLEVERAEGELARADPPAPEATERWFEVEFARSVFELALATLRRESLERGRAAALRAFELCDVEEPPPGAGRPSYEGIAAQLGVPVTTVTNHLSLMRRELRRIVLHTLRELTASDEEFRLEARQLLGLDPP
jgi:RNA polymerase sigma factor (sigma-70 family)